MGQFGLPTFKPQEQPGIARVPTGDKFISNGGYVQQYKRTPTQDELNSMGMDELKTLAGQNDTFSSQYGPGMMGWAIGSGVKTQAQNTWDTRRQAELKAQTDAANAQRAAAEAASAEAAKVAESARQQGEYTKQARTQGQVQQANAINVQAQIRDYQNRAPEQAQADVSAVTADGASGGAGAGAGEDQRKRPGGFTQRATGIRIS
ncbi:hypothetical protein JG068_030 [Burkholderia phage JG068]|uniref:Uncharacterized protein n=1 Tax=Burkholderia phage JG068 TaxID=1401297 RepID=U3PBA8_9CAUD|nr:hypothetical protein JG068_030 [Burkholderia phage JG068]AGW43612.1 hypothetical protein JG068_030 [Burkholderia phage JG068]